MSKKSEDIKVKQETTVAAPPRNPFAVLRQEVDRLFDDFAWPSLGRSTGRGIALMEPFRGWAQTWGDVPAMDLIERDAHYELTAELPGIDSKDIDLQLSGDTLTVKAEKSQEKTEEKGDYRLQERSYGKIHRALSLPAGIDTDKVEAKFEDGVLKVTLPKSDEAEQKGRKIEVRAA